MALIGANPPMFRRFDAQGALEARRGEITRVDEMAGGHFFVGGEIDFEGSGEFLWDVIFPVLFTEMPLPLFGSYLAPSQSLEPGNYPQITSTVKNWTTRRSEDRQTALAYEGATIASVCLGHEGMLGTVTFLMLGIALQNPLTQSGNVEGTI